MTTCLFCKRDDVPRVPLLPITAQALVAHVDNFGNPCLEGSDPEAHAHMLGDFPHVELMDDDASWDFDGTTCAVVDAQPEPKKITRKSRTRVSK